MIELPKTCTIANTNDRPAPSSRSIVLPDDLTELLSGAEEFQVGEVNESLTTHAITMVLRIYNLSSG